MTDSLRPPTIGHGPQGRRTCMRGIKRARIALLTAVTAGALLALPGAANAGVLVASAPNCDNGSTSQPFAQWGDDSQYFLAPGGNFESGLSGWDLNGAS